MLPPDWMHVAFCVLFSLLSIFFLMGYVCGKMAILF